jgi:hypothetical protein
VAKLPAFAVKHRACLADDDDPYCFYHATPASNLPSILRDGLHPRGSGHTFDTTSWSAGKLFLAYGIEAGWQWQGFVFEMVLEPVALLEVRLTPAQLRQVHVDELARAEGDTCTFYVNFSVPPSSLCVIDVVAGF